MNDNMNGVFLEHDDFEIDLVEVFSALMRRGSLIVFVMMLCGVLCFSISAFLIKPTYSAEAMMIVNSGESATTYVTSDQLRSSASLVDTYSIIIKSNTVKNQVMENLSMEETYEDEVKWVRVEAVDATQIMKISVGASDPNTALTVCEEITKVCPDLIVRLAEAGSANIVTKAETDGIPVSPNVKGNTILGVILGFLITCGIIVLNTILNNKVTKEADIRQMGLNTLGIIPSYNEGGK